MSLFYPLQIVQFSGIKDIQIATITTIHVQSFFIFLKWNSARLHLKQSLAVQWCRLCAPNAGGSGLIPSWETKILHAAWRSKKKKQKKTHNDSHPTLFPAPGNRHFPVCFSEFDKSRYLVQMEATNNCHCVSGLLHSAWCSQGSSML